MINFSKISNKKFFGKLLRKILLIIPDGTTVRILQGKLKGKKWIKGSGVDGYWLGSYESEQVKIFKKEIKKDDVFFDIGANVGFYSLLGAEIVGSSGKVFAFEPLPENFKYLKKHIEINNYKNIYSFEVAISNKVGIAFFGGVINRSQGHLVESGSLKVETISIDEWVKENKLLAPTVIKIDVEGAEMAVLNGAKNTIANNHPVLFLSTHSEELHKNCCDFLTSLRYKLIPIGTDDIAKATEVLAKI